jgi:hypothetical protein
LCIELKQIHNALERSPEIERKRYVFLVGLKKIGPQIKSLIPSKRDRIQLVEGRFEKIISAMKKSGIFVLSDGELENYLPEYVGDPYIISDKRTRFHFGERPQ